MASQGITHFIVIHKLDSYSSLSTIYIKCTQFKPCQFTQLIILGVSWHCWMGRLYVGTIITVIAISVV